jgi:hypothetical protein
VFENGEEGTRFARKLERTWRIPPCTLVGVIVIQKLRGTLIFAFCWKPNGISLAPIPAKTKPRLCITKKT